MHIDMLYEYLLLATNLNFTKTAKSFYISQSVLSNHISSLEKELGVKLFTRSSHSVCLTEAGELFRENAIRVLFEYERMITDISYYRNGASSVLRIGFLLGTYGSFLPRACREYRAFNPAVEFSLKVLGIGDMQPLLKKEIIDIGLALYGDNIRDEDYGYCTLFKDYYKFAVPKTHRLASAPSLSFDDLKGETVLTPRFNAERSTISQVSRQLENAGVNVVHDYRITDAESLVMSIIGTEYISLVLDHLELFSGDELVFISAEDNSCLEVCAGAIWKKSRETDVMTSFVKYLRRISAGLTKQDFLAHRTS